MSIIENRDQLSSTPAAALALACLETGIEAAKPARVVERQLRVGGDELEIRSVDGTASTYDLGAYDEIVVVGGGNAAGPVAAALETLLGDRITGGVVVTDEPRPTDTVETVEGTHPVPSEANVDGTRRVLEYADRAGSETLVLAPVTGGGSALLAAPDGAVDLDSLRDVTEDLLKAGLSIDRINAVRKHLSAIKGGGLAERARPATVVGLLFSDVVGDDLSVIASGPTAPDASTYEDAVSVLERAGVDPPSVVEKHLTVGASGELTETVDAEAFSALSVENHVVANGYTALSAARDRARSAGLDALVLSGRIEGEASEAAGFHVAVAEECASRGEPISPPAVILSGGETTVEVGGTGRGGPNHEFALAAGLELPADGSVTVGSVDTDGIDGNAETAGAIVAGTAGWDRAAARAALDRNDAYGFLSERRATIRTGRTGTNVNDLRVVVLAEPDGALPAEVDLDGDPATEPSGRAREQGGDQD